MKVKNQLIQAAARNSSIFVTVLNRFKQFFFFFLKSPQGVIIVGQNLQQNPELSYNTTIVSQKGINASILRGEFSGQAF